MRRCAIKCSSKTICNKLGVPEDTEIAYGYFHYIGQYSDGDDSEIVAVVESDANHSLVEVSPPLIQFLTEPLSSDSDIKCMTKALVDIVTELQYLTQILSTDTKVRLI